MDAAFLAQGILRAPRALRESLDPATTKHLIAALESTRVISPGFNNWLLFSATVEAGLAKLGAWWDKVRVDYALRHPQLGAEFRAYLTSIDKAMERAEEELVV